MRRSQTRDQMVTELNLPRCVLTRVLLTAMAAVLLTASMSWAEAPEEVVVVGVGETLLAVEVEQALESRLTESDVAVLDERGLLAVEELLGDRSGPLSLAVVEALRPYATMLVLVRAEYLGNRPLYYMQRSDATFQSRVIVSVIDLGSGDPGETLVNTRVEYTRFNVEEVAERVARKKVRRLQELVAP